MTGPVLRATGLPHDLRKSAPYCGYETYDFDVITRTGCDAYDRLRIRIDEMYESLKIVEQTLDRLQRTEGQPVMVAGQEDRLAGPAGHRRRRPGQQPRPHPRDHGQLDGVAHPPLQAGHRGLPGAARAGLRGGRVGQGRAGLPRRVRRRHPPLPGALPRPELQQPAGRGRRCARAARSPTSSSPWRRSTPSWEVSTADVPRLRPPDRVRAPHRQCGVQGALPRRRRGALPRRRRRGHRALPAEALGAAAAAAPRAVASTATSPAAASTCAPSCSTSPPPRSPASRRSTRSTSATPTAPTPSGSAPTRCARSWAATRSGMPCPSTSASATTRPPPTARSPSSASSATPPATSPRSS